MTLISDLRDACLDHDEANGWKRVECVIRRDWWEDAERRAGVRKLFLGMHAATDLARRWREVDQSQWPVPPGEMARAYIGAALTAARPMFKPRSPVARGRIPWRSDALVHLPLRPAQFLTPGHRRGRWAIVDIDRAYWQLAREATADVFFRVHRDVVTFGLGKIEWLRAAELVDKDVAVSVVGMLGKQTIDWWRYGVQAHRPETCGDDCRGPHVETVRKLLAPDLVGLVAWTMHAIATEARDLFDARMYMVDAAILPEDRALDYLDWLRQRWGLSARVKAHGPGMIYGINRYRIGNAETVDVARGATQETGPLDNLLPCPPAVCEALAALRWCLVERSREVPPWPTTT